MYVVIKEAENKMYIAATTTVVNKIVTISRNTLYKHWRNHPETGYRVNGYVIFKAKKIDFDQPISL